MLNNIEIKNQSRKLSETPVSSRIEKIGIADTTAANADTFVPDKQNERLLRRGRRRTRSMISANSGWRVALW